MAGFGNLYSGMDDENFDYDKNYDPDEVFRNFGSTDAMEPKAHRPVVSRTEGGVIVETRKRRSIKLPY
ncbi:hypothetical protein G6L37_02115 [Agrobacterium rubi]|nr:hypothetical protein [Agrobacterium rubi]NTF24189.1 hypothetical protein [Agrobacterium rubi]